MPHTATPHTVVFKNCAGHLVLDPLGFVRLVWAPGVQQSAAVRTLMEQLFQLLEKTGWGKVLLDQREFSFYSAEDCTWLLLDWLPRAVNRAGYRYCAILVAHNIFTRLASNATALQAQARYGLTSHCFDDDQQEEAAHWLVARA